MRKLITCPLLLSALALAGCDSSGSGPQPDLGGGRVGAPVSAPKELPQRNFSTQVLLFDGDGAWGPEVPALEAILKENGVSYKAASSAEINAMSVDELADFGTIVWPGGSGTLQARSMSAAARQNLREAVRDRGVNFIGFCAGAFLAGETFHILDEDLKYYHLENEGTPYAMTMTEFADGSRRDLLWYGGPVTPDLPGGVVARYPNGDPWITQLWAGNGFVIVTGGHPAAPMSVRSEFGLSDRDGSDAALAWQLIQAAMSQKALPAF